MSGMLGIGGGIIIVPALTILVGFELQKATGTSLAALLLPVGLPAVIAYHRAGKLHLQPALWVAFGLLVGAFFGANIALGLDVKTLQKLYGVFVLVMSWRFVEPRKWLAERRAAATGAAQSALNEPSSAVTNIEWYWLLGVGLSAGILSGMFGIGGGIVIVPALAGLMHMDQKLAVGTSLGALLLPVGLGAVIQYYNAGKLDIVVAIPVAVGLVTGALFGARIALGMSAKTVKRLYGIFLFFVALRFFLQS